MRKHGDVNTAKHVFGDPQLGFWSKVVKTETCWEWTGAKNRLGYGTFHIAGKSGFVHRIAYTWLVGPIPDGVKVDHVCHTPSCVRPEHLRLATQKQNGENRDPGKISRPRGVTRTSPTRWRAAVTHNYRKIHVGYFDTEAEATAAAAAKRNELFTHNDLDRKPA